MKKTSYRKFCEAIDIPSKLTFIVLIFNFLLIIVSSVTLLMLQNIINETLENMKFTFNYFLIITIALILLYVLLSGVVNFSFNYLTFMGACGARRCLYRKILQNPELTREFQSGDLLGCAFEDAAGIGNNVANRKIHVFGGILEIAVILVILFYYSWIIALITIAFYPLFFYLNTLISKKDAENYKQLLVRHGQARQTFLQGIRGVFLLKLLKKEKYYNNKFEKDLINFKKPRIKSAFYGAINLSSQVLVAISLPALMVIVSLVFVENGRIQAGTLLLIFALVSNLIQPANQLNFLISGYINDKRAYERVAPVFDYPEHKEGDKEVEQIENISINISEFAYGEEKPILKDFDFSFKKGDRIGIVGESGCGKSTILKLLTRQEELNDRQGSITINGIPLKDIKTGSLYKEMLISSQNNFLFEGSLTENLCMGDSFADEQINEVIEVCCLEKFVEEYGFDRAIKEDSANVSGGQLQRICLARILLRKPELLLLDEPTAALDNEVSELLAKRLEQFLNKYNISFIAVTHKEDILSIVNKTIKMYPLVIE